MELKDLTLSEVFLSGRANKICRVILKATQHQANGRSFPELINRIVVDYTREDEEESRRFLRLYYLHISLKHSMLWDKGVSAKVHFRKPAMEFMRGLQEFSSSRKVPIKIPDVPNVLIHDYIACVELKGKDFSEHYLEKHLITTI